MTQLVVLFSCFGLAYVVGFSVISLRVRLWIAGPDEVPSVKDGVVVPLPRPKWRQVAIDLLECPACFGYWVGLALGAFSDVLVPDIVAPAWVVRALMTAFAVAGMNYFIARITKLVPPFVESGSDTLGPAFGKYVEILQSMERQARAAQVVSADLSGRAPPPGTPPQ